MSNEQKILQNIKIITITHEFNSFNAQDLIDILTYADSQYFNSDVEVIPDVEYDMIKHYVKTLLPTHNYFTSVGSSVRSGKIPLPFPLMSLNQVYQGDTIKWVEKHNLLNEKLIISDKLDGASGLTQHTNYKLQIGYSRGNGIEGADITRHLSKLTSVPSTIDGNNSLSVRGEIIVSKGNFNIIIQKLAEAGTKTYANARNMVAGLMNSKQNPDWIYEYIDFISYEAVGLYMDKNEQLLHLDLLGFHTPWYITAYGRELTDEFLTDILNSRRKQSPYEIDGLVIDINSTNIRQQLATTEAVNPSYAVKYKVLSVDDIVETTVVAVEWNISKHGALKPKVIVEAVHLFGTTVRAATAFNAAYIWQNNIGPGTRIQITKSGMVIPYIHGIVSSTTASMPDIEYYWNDTNVDIFVSNPDQFEAITIKKLIDFFTTIKVPSLKEGNVTKLVNAGYTTPDEIINLSLAEMETALGSDIIGERVFEGIITRLTDIPLYTLMGSYSTSRGIGARKIKQLYDHYNDKLLDITDISDIILVSGFDVKTAEKTLHEIIRFKGFFKIVQAKCTIKITSTVTTGALSGEHIVFTGFRDVMLEEYIEKQGGIVQSGVNKKTTTLLVSDINDNSTKVTKAKALNINILTAQNFKGLHEIN